MKMVTFLFLASYFNFIKVFGQSSEPPYVIMVSFDGFRSDYVTRFDAGTFRDFASKGVVSEGLIPCFPSKTFPNHYTLVTGLYPGNHGLVDNSFYDPEREVFYGMSMREKVVDSYFYSGVPLWQLARQHNVKSASYFWVGSELSQVDLRPDYYYPYKESVPDTIRVDQVLDWLTLPEDERPHFITLYFSSPDYEGHLYGPTSEETRRAVLNADSLLFRLMEGLKQIDLPVNVVIVSDHGMRELPNKPESNIFLDELMDINDPSIKISNGGTQAHVYVKNKRNRDSLYKKLKSKSINYAVYKQRDFPSRWHYNVSRAGDILITANDGYYFRERMTPGLQKFFTRGGFFGVHGYDPEHVQDMYGIFMAQGPNVKSGVTLPAFKNIHVYPFVAKILNLTIPAIDGSIEVLEGVYQK